MDKFLLLTEEVRASYVRCGMPGHVLLACSGGADSTALLLALHALQDRQFPADPIFPEVNYAIHSDPERYRL